MKRSNANINLIVIALLLIPIFTSNLFAQEKQERGYKGSINRESLLAELNKVHGRKGKAVIGYIVKGDDIIDIIRKTNIDIKIRYSIIEGGLNFSKLPAVSVKKVEAEGWNEQDKEHWLKKQHGKLYSFHIITNKIGIINCEIQALPAKEGNFSDTSIIASNTYFRKSIEFNRSTFNGTTYFHNSLFIDEVDFYNVDFGGDASFGNTVYFKAANFRDAIFRGGASFNYAIVKKDVDFSNISVSKNIGFQDVIFSSEASFYKASFNGFAGFSSVTFSKSAGFSDATFNGEAKFENVTFKGIAYFSRAIFNDKANFHSATMNKYGSFQHVIMNGEVDFANVTFNNVVRFNNSRFNGVTKFQDVTFNKYVYFNNSTFNGVTKFHNATFKTNVSFNDSTFNGFTDFSQATFNSVASFSVTTFNGIAIYYNATFNKDVFFNETIFNKLAYFREASFHEVLNIRYISFNEYADFRDTKIRKLDYNSTESPSVINGHVDFRNALISAAHFQNIFFNNDVYFSDANFGAPLDDKEMGTSNSNISDQRVAEKGAFSPTVFKYVTFESDASFLRTKFHGDIAFENVIFKTDANFTDSVFKATKDSGKQKISFSYLSFKNLLIKWDQLPDMTHWVSNHEDKIKSYQDVEEEAAGGEKETIKEKELEPLSRVFKRLKVNFRRINQLSDANSAHYYMKTAELKEIENSDNTWLKFLKNLEWIFWGIPCGYGTKIWWILGWSAFFTFLFAMIFNIKGELHRKQHPEKKQEFTFKLRLRDFPKQYYTGENMLEDSSKYDRKIINALRFSAVILFKVGYRDTTISGKIVGIDYKSIVRIEWALGYYIISVLVVTLSNTLPIINRFMSGVFL